MNQQVILRFFLLFGRSPRLPIDAIFDPQPETGAISHAEYVTKWKTAMQEAYSLALKSATKSAIRGKRNHDKRVRSSALQVGDRVQVRNLTPRSGLGKLRAFWEDEIHVVIARKGEGSPVYDARSESGLPDFSHHYLSPGNDGNDQSQIQVQSASKEAVGVEPNPPNVNSDGVSGQIEASAIITDSPDEVPTTENPQAIGGETSMEEDASNRGRPQRARQGPKRQTSDSLGNPTYVREINAGPPTEINQVGIPSPVPYIPAPPVNQYSMLPPPTTGFTPPAVP